MSENEERPKANATSGLGSTGASVADLLSHHPPAKEVTVDVCRRAEIGDVDGIRKLMSTFTSSIFGNQNPIRLIERSIISIVLLSPEGEVVAFGAFCDFPLQPRHSQPIPRTDWYRWLADNYTGVGKCSSLTTLFCHLLVAKAGFSSGLYEELMHSVFAAMPTSYQVVLASTEEVSLGTAIPKVFHEKATCKVEKEAAQENSGSKTSKPPALPYPEVLFCRRRDYLPNLHIRAARENDSDDLVKLFEPAELEQLTSQYGDYFLAEMIRYNNEEAQSFVAECYGKTVGFCHVSTRVDVEGLVSSYQLDFFHNLCATQRPLSSAMRDEQPQAPSTDSESDRCATPAVVTPSPDPHRISALKQSSTRSSVKSTASVTFKESATIMNAGDEQELSGGGGDQAKLATSSAGLASKVNVASPMVSAVRTSPEPAEASESGQSAAHSSLASVSLDNSSHTRSVIMDGGTEEEEEAAVPQSNVFSIRMFRMNPDYESRGKDFLTHLFSTYQGKEFCVITQPSTANEHELLQSFVHVDRRLRSKTPDELYLVHRHFLLSDFDTHLATTEDYPAIVDYLALLKQGDIIRHDIDSYLHAGRDPEQEGSCPLHTVVTYCLGELISIAVLRDVEEPDWLRAHYDIEHITNFSVLQPHEHKMLHHFVLSPQFLARQGFLLSDVLRVTKATCAYYCLHEGHRPPPKGAKAFTPTPALTLMHLAKHRRQITYSKKLETEPSARIIRYKPPCSLFHINRKLLHEPPACINIRIVVVGASDAGLAFLSALANRMYIRLTNLVLVDPYGLPGHDTPKHNDREEALPDSLLYPAGKVCLSGMSAWISVVRGKMVSLNRERQEVLLDNRRRVPYDELIICTGTQFNPALSVQAAVRRVQGLAVKGLERSLEPNVLTYTNAQQADRAITFVETVLTKSEGAVVVYGDRVVSYTAVRMLLKRGIAADRVHLVLPPVDESDADRHRPSFPDAVVAEEMSKTIKDLGVIVHHSWKLLNWMASTSSSQDGVEPLALSFKTDDSDDSTELTADALFYFDKKTVDTDAFLAVNSSHLVFDRRLVIDHDFLTADPRIHAMGSCTKYQLKMYREDWKHSMYNSKEIGLLLADRFLEKYAVPKKESAPAPAPHPADNDKPTLSPLFEEPLSVRACLPGGYTYVHMDVPPRMESTAQPGDKDRELSTRTDEGYIRLKFTRGIIKSITILTKKESLEVENVICLFGCHELVMKGMLGFHEKKPIADLFEFLRQEWMTIFFHDRYQELQEQWLLLTRSPTNKDGQSLLQYARELMEVTRGPPDKEDVVELGRCHDSTRLTRRVQDLLMDYLMLNHYHLPMYAIKNILVV